MLLRTIDTLWVDHLTELDDMRRGIGLRGYGGIDPLNEFKREAFKLYEELRGFISKQVANTIFRVIGYPGRRQPAPDETSRWARARQQLPRRTATGAPDRTAASERDGSDADRARPRLGGGAPRADPVPARGRAGGRAARSGQGQWRQRQHGGGAEARPQRPVLLRQRQEVQALPRGVIAT